MSRDLFFENGRFLKNFMPILGFETARALALRNGHVVLGCRSIVRAIEARGDILTEKVGVVSLV